MKRRKKVSADPAHLYYSGAAVRLLARLVARKHGIRLGEILREVDAAQRMSVDELQAYRDRKFVALARYCYEHVPYYRELFRQAGMSPDSFLGLADLRSIPPLTKEILRQRYNARTRGSENKWKQPDAS
jgi:phenylacetate-coenzyme A ligase PaaK-like adenylate-forming protein